jgi:catechol 2,3-dioxygenase-like lactoylglutathione lyase family enzyme
VSHAVLRSGSTKRLMDWYVDVLDGHVIFEAEGLAFMTYDEEHHRLGIQQIPGDVAPVNYAAPGLVHLAFAYDSPQELVALYKRLRDKRVYPRLTVNHGLTLSLYYQDPDGNGVECLVDLLPPKEATELMHSPAFARNPVGLLLDPEELLTRVDGGLTEGELTASFKNTEIDVPATLAEIHELMPMPHDDYIEFFEAKLAARTG